MFFFFQWKIDILNNMAVQWIACYPNFFILSASPYELHTLSLHDALPISAGRWLATQWSWLPVSAIGSSSAARTSRRSVACGPRSEENTSELQSQFQLVCRLLPVKKICLLEAYVFFLPVED